MNTYWTFIVGMLTNLGPMGIDQIHNMLNMMLQGEIEYTAKKEELKLYLDSKIQEDKLELLQSTMYKLKKTN